MGPGLLVTVGFIDPGNWAANVAAGSSYGLTLLWMVSLATIMLVLLQHNAAHLGIATGLCLSEAATQHLSPWMGRSVLATALMASVATAMAEILGGAIALHMLFGLPYTIGAVGVALVVFAFLFRQSYRRVETWIIGFVSLIGLCFLIELWMVDVDWKQAAGCWVTPRLPAGALPILMSVLGAVVMPHNLFLHSEIIQSREWNLKDAATIRHQLKYEFADTLFSMGVGWAINSAMILVAATVFFKAGVPVTELEQAERMLRPLLGSTAAWVFALALLFAGLASSITAGMAGGVISAGLSGRPYDMADRHTRWGVVSTLALATGLIFFIRDPFKALIVSQICLSLQLPLTIFLQLRLTGSRRVMGAYANSPLGNVILWSIGGIVTVLNVLLLRSLI